MNIEYFNEYLKYEHKGIKSKTKEYVNMFIKSFENDMEKGSWTIEYLPKFEQNSNGRIRNELFEEIIFPVLFNGYKNKDIKLMVWLVKLSQNYYQNNRIWKQLNYRSEMEIIKECYDIEPDNKEVQDIYLEIKINKMEFIIHEYPPYILFGNNVATKDECKILLDDIVFIKKLDRNNKYEKFINEYKRAIKEYMGIENSK
jgi:uncharacterized protein YsxB (DUF464 family)